MFGRCLILLCVRCVVVALISGTPGGGEHHHRAARRGQSDLCTALPKLFQQGHPVGRASVAQPVGGRAADGRVCHPRQGPRALLLGTKDQRRRERLFGGLNTAHMTRHSPTSWSVNCACASVCSDGGGAAVVVFKVFWICVPVCWLTVLGVFCNSVFLCPRLGCL